MIGCTQRLQIEKKAICARHTANLPRPDGPQAAFKEPGDARANGDTPNRAPQGIYVGFQQQFFEFITVAAIWRILRKDH